MIVIFFYGIFNIFSLNVSYAPSLIYLFSFGCQREEVRIEKRVLNEHFIID